jgi:hypothetical protein
MGVLIKSPEGASSLTQDIALYLIKALNKSPERAQSIACFNPQ